jgi:hypothetical protein
MLLFNNDSVLITMGTFHLDYLYDINDWMNKENCGVDECEEVDNKNPKVTHTRWAIITESAFLLLEP